MNVYVGGRCILAKTVRERLRATRQEDTGDLLQHEKEIEKADVCIFFDGIGR